MEDYEFTCPYCWQPNNVLLDLSAGGQQYIQDCEVCCNPIEISYEVAEGRAVNVTASDIGQ